MLASPLLPQPSFSSKRANEESSQYSPSRDLDAFNKLLPPPVEFIEGSSSGSLAVPDGKYEPINVTPKAPRSEVRHVSPPSPFTPKKSLDVSGSPPPKSPLPSSPSKSPSLCNGPLKSTWFPKSSVGAGMYNTGNTCFLNSALQCLLHTSPLLHILDAHGKIEPCRMNGGFCMACTLGEVARLSYSRRSSFNPYQITSRLNLIAKHMRRGRQEDSHEFLRYAIDALQKSCLAGYPAKLEHKLAESTWVHKIFGGRLRSRVTCRECGHNSDTFDSILDLSLDIFGATTLKQALRKFVAIEHLGGADRYKCEKCKKPVIAEKQFTLHDCPYVLTVHLKRFSPLGRKIGHHVKYDEQLSLQPYMSEGQFGPTYSLYGVICHAGSGPNSGHYYAYVKGRDGWYEMNDEMVTHYHGAPVSLKSAYMLFYLRDKGQALDAAVNSTPSSSSTLAPTSTTTADLSLPKVRLSMRKRRVIESDDEDEDDIGFKIERPFIGPVLPPPSSSPLSSPCTTPDIKRIKTTHDPQAEAIKKKIEAVITCPGGFEALAQYASSSGGEEQADEDTGDVSDAAVGRTEASPLPSSQTTKPSSPRHSPEARPSVLARPGTPISPPSFYASSANEAGRNHTWKKKSPTWPAGYSPPNNRFLQQAGSPLKNRNYDPWTRLSRGGNLHNRQPVVINTYSRKRRT